VLPYMQQSGIIIQHDTVLDHLHYKDTNASPVFGLACISMPVLFAVMRSDKFKPQEFNREIYPTANIGAHRINDDTWKYIDDMFWALNLKWRLLPSVKDMEHIVKVLEKHYDRKNVDMLLRNYELNKKLGVDWTPSASPDIKQITRRVEKLEKRTYMAFAGITGFLAALVMTVCILALRL
jgi:hypothetical protein